MAYLVLQAVNLHEAIFPEESGDWFAIETSWKCYSNEVIADNTKAGLVAHNKV